MTTEGALGSSAGRLHGVATKRARAKKQAKQTEIDLERELRRRQALEINDNIVQGLTVAKYALDAGDGVRAKEALERTLESARKIVTELLNQDETPYLVLGPGDLVRTEPATVVIVEPE